MYCIDNRVSIVLESDAVLLVSSFCLVACYVLIHLSAVEVNIHCTMLHCCCSSRSDQADRLLKTIHAGSPPGHYTCRQGSQSGHVRFRHALGLKVNKQSVLDKTDTCRSDGSL